MKFSLSNGLQENPPKNGHMHFFDWGPTPSVESHRISFCLVPFFTHVLEAGSHGNWPSLAENQFNQVDLKCDSMST